MVAVQCVWLAGSLFVFVSFLCCICILFVLHICISYLHLFVFAVIIVDNFKFQCDHLHCVQPLYIQHQCCNPYGKVTITIVMVMIIPHCEVSESKHEHICRCCTECLEGLGWVSSTSLLLQLSATTSTQREPLLQVLVMMIVMLAECDGLVSRLSFILDFLLVSEPVWNLVPHKSLKIDLKQIQYQEKSRNWSQKNLTGKSLGIGIGIGLL